METPATSAVRSMWAAFTQGGVESFLDHVEPDAELVPWIVGEGGTLHGHEEIRRWYHQVVAGGRRVESVLYGTEELGDHVLAHGGLRVIAEGELSDTQLYWLFHAPGGRVRRAESFASRAGALEALGRANVAA